jgi:hypothetical protein
MNAYLALISVTKYSRDFFLYVPDPSSALWLVFDLASNSNEYQESSWGKGRPIGAWDRQTHCHLWPVI